MFGENFVERLALVIAAGIALAAMVIGMIIGYLLA